MSSSLEPPTEMKDLTATEDTNRAVVQPLESGIEREDEVGMAMIAQERVIPITAERKVTTKWEYWLYTVFCEPSLAPPCFPCESN